MHKRESLGDELTIYDLVPEANLQVLIASTPQTTRILTEPEICGVAFQDSLSAALNRIIHFLHDSDKGVGQALRESQFDVLYILRGGLNFDLHRSLTQVTSNKPEVTFISSPITGSNGIFEITEPSYEKWSLQNASLLCVGDICGTGTTLINSLDRLVVHYDLEGKIPRWILIITIGTFDALSSLQHCVSRLLSIWQPQLTGATIVFLEQVFDLYKGGDLLSTTHVPYADFFRKSFPVAPEFERSSLASPMCFLERCAAYNVGSRAFQPNTYLDNLRKYWMLLAEQSDSLDMPNLLKLKSNLLDYRLTFASWRRIRPWWDDIDKSVLQDIHENGSYMLDQLLSGSLTEICETRISKLTGKISPSSPPHR